jgi:hypothetical protein
MELLDFVRTLTWAGGSTALADMRRAYDDVLAERFGAVLGHIVRHRPDVGTRIVELYRVLPESAMLRFLRAPETSHRLLWETQRAFDDLPRFLESALAAEARRVGLAVSAQID